MPYLNSYHHPQWPHHIRSLPSPSSWEMTLLSAGASRHFGWLQTTTKCRSLWPPPRRKIVLRTNTSYYYLINQLSQCCERITMMGSRYSFVDRCRGRLWVDLERFLQRVARLVADGFNPKKGTPWRRSEKIKDTTSELVRNWRSPITKRTGFNSHLLAFNW